MAAAFLNLLYTSPFIIDIDFEGILGFALIGFGMGFLLGLILQEFIEQKWI